MMTKTTRSWRVQQAMCAAGMMVFGLVGCASDSENVAQTVVSMPAQPSPPADGRVRTFERGEALSLVNSYRIKNGLQPLLWDGRLTAIAEDTAVILARKDKLKTPMHTARGLAKRLDGSGYVNVAAAENLGGGYLTLSDAFEGWKASKDHNKNLLNKHVTHMGLALKVQDTGRFKSFWVMLLARPVTVSSDGRYLVTPGIQQ